MDEESPLAGRTGEQEDGDGGGEDNPDWRMFAKFARSQSRLGDGAVEAFIPRRGEKDFEPDKSRSNRQADLLADSRDALFSALSAGARGHNSKENVCCIWHRADPLQDETGHAHVEGTAKGVMFTSMGSWNRERKRLELLPEEVLYLFERGTVECWTDGPRNGVPMTVQWAWTEMIGSDDLTLERYQVYAYLRRLGYIVLRKSHVDAIHRSSSSAVLRSPHPAVSTSLIRRLIDWHLLPSRHLLAVLSYPLRRLWYGLDWALRREYWGASGVLIRPGYWPNYDSIFSALRLVPAGTSTNFTKPPSKISSDAYDIFFYAYRPTNHFGKSAPPPPEFQIAVVDASKAMLPDLYQMLDVFDTAYEAPYATPTSVKAVHPPPPSLLQRLRSAVPFVGRTTDPVKDGKWQGKRSPTVFTRLKGGTRDAILAVVDNGLISFLRFIETDFDAAPLAGNGRS